MVTLVIITTVHTTQGIETTDAITPATLILATQIRVTGIYLTAAVALFCTVPHKIYIFNRPSGLTLEGWRTSEGYRILSRARTTRWIPRPLMSLQERITYPEYKQFGGYLKSQSLKEACAELWAQLSESEKNAVRAIPNFNEEIFYKITGIHAATPSL